VNTDVLGVQPVFVSRWEAWSCVFHWIVQVLLTWGGDGETLGKKGTVLAGSLSNFVMPEITSNW